MRRDADLVVELGFPVHVDARHHVAAVAVGLQAVAQRVAPEVALVEEVAAVVEHQVAAQGAAFAQQGRRDVRRGLTHAGRNFRVVLKFGQGDARAHGCGGYLFQLRDVLQADHMAAGVEAALVVGQQVGAAGDEVGVVAQLFRQCNGVGQCGRLVKLKLRQQHRHGLSLSTALREEAKGAKIAKDHPLLNTLRVLRFLRLFA
ncbi:MAG: hypothetical protein ICCCNLDF_02675 [Planctomycetes bacterium]|nr:hypothetical protein [Planctomycetota bacterium]